MSAAFRLLLITPPDGTDHDLVRTLARALDTDRADRVAVLLRRPGASARALFALATTLRPLVAARGGALLLSDRVDVALAVDADGAQLPERGLAVRDARQLLHPPRLVGASRHDAPGLRRAAADGADYATVGPVHEVSKAPPLGRAGVAHLLAEPLALARYPLGGVTVDDVAPLVRAGAAGVAVIRCVFEAPDPAAQVRALVDAAERADPRR